MPEGLIGTLTWVGLAIVGACLGALANVLVEAWTWFPRYRTPWRRPIPPGRTRPWWVYLPIVGWLGLRDTVPGTLGRELPPGEPDPTAIGPWYWLRGLVIEVLCAIALPLLFQHLVEQNLVPSRATVPEPDAFPQAMIWFGLFAVILYGLILATLIDLEDQTIPDQVTVTGTVFALLYAAVFPASRLPVWANPKSLAVDLSGLQISSPHGFPGWLKTEWGLVLAVVLIVGWIFAILPRRVILRRGPIKAVQFFLARMVRGLPEWLFVGLGALLVVVTWAVWQFGQAGSTSSPAAGLDATPLDAWQSYVSAVIGLAVGGGVVWAIRLLGRLALGQEAMGFGDVLLMAMVGAAFGWQVAVLSFFLAPFGALVISVGGYLMTGQHHIAFGPYLAIGAAAVTLAWARFWFGWADSIFAMGELLIAILFAGLTLMTALLFVIRLVKSAFRSESREIANERES